ncbi:MAG: hypothetical protein AB1758_34595, partial [Candidatus Eremiobacterota bacterium]
MKRWLAALWVLILSAGALAAPQDAGDLYARSGAYTEADRLYREALAQTKDPTVRRILLQRRLAVAQVQNDIPTALALVGELEGMLRQSPDPEVELRVRLVQGALAYRMGQVGRSRDAFQKAEGVAARMSGPGAALARY